MADRLKEVLKGAFRAPKRKEQDSDEQPVAKRQKRCPSDDLVCPITLELPLDPVTADDGRIYERSAIEKHIEKTCFGFREMKHCYMIRSPLTNKVVGTKLLPAPQIKNLIETLIENGSITGKVAEDWTEKRRTQQEKELLLEAAENGNGQAMVQIAMGHYDGKGGFVENKQRAYAWFRRAHEAGNVNGTLWIGCMLCDGIGAPRQSSIDGMMYITRAAARGSPFAASKLGHAYADGKFGLAINLKEAQHWLRKAIEETSSMDTQLSGSELAKAKQKLEEIESKGAAELLDLA